VQNLKRDGAGINAKITAVMNGGLGLASPVETVGDIARAFICAAPGHRFLIGDFSGIESRVLAFLSGQESKRAQWRAFDASGALEDNPYYVLGRSCGLPESLAYIIGKIIDLAFGFMGGVGAWEKLAPEDDATDEATVKRYQQAWRDAHPHTVDFWYKIDRAAIAAVQRPDVVVASGRFTLTLDAPFLRITLPSGRALSYPFPRLGVGKFGDPIVIYKDNAEGKWVDCRFGRGAYGGIWTENIVQAGARDLLATAMLRLEAAGYHVVLHVHDEVVVEVPDGFGSLEEFQRLLTMVPAWADGLPIAAKVRAGLRFSKPDGDSAIPDDFDGEVHPNIGGESESTIPDSAAKSAEMVAAESAEAESWDAVLAGLSTDEVDVEGTPVNGPQAVISGNGAAESARGNGHDQQAGANDHRGDYHAGTKHEGKPFSDAHLRRQGYQLARIFPYCLPDGVKLYEECRYELPPGVVPSKNRPRKTSRFRRIESGSEIFGTGLRRILYNWPEIMRAGPGATVHITEGANKSAALNEAGLLATAVAHHQWPSECVDALAGRHLMIHEDHDDGNGDDPGPKLAAAARDKLAPRAASIRIIPAAHLWIHLPPDSRAIRRGDDVKDWLKLGGDPTKLLDICHKIPADGDFSTVPLSLDEWFSRDLPELDPILGEVLTTTTRAVLHANTGLGKTHFGMAAWGHAAAGKDFLHWHCPQPRRMLYIDGEMSRRLFKERLEDMVRRLGGKPPTFAGFNREDIPNFAPLNTPEGQAAIWKLIEEVERRTGGPLDAVCFDNIMALIIGDMKEEEAWRDTMPLILELTRRRIGQLWLHHTGHDTSRGYGTKTREWNLDMVVHMDAVERPDTRVSFTLSFPKARERCPRNWDDFADINLALVNDCWISAAALGAKVKISPTALKFLAALRAAAARSTIKHMSGVDAASMDEWQAECIAQGLIDVKAKPDSARAMLSKYRQQLIVANQIAANPDAAWIL
jgi:hypothetical protein